MNFNSHTDTVVATTVSLVNALTPGERRGRPYPSPEGPERLTAVTGVLRTTTEITPAEAVELARIAAELRTVFEAVAAGDVDAAAHQVNRLMRDTQARPHLERHDGEPWHLHFDGPGQTFAASWAAGFAVSLAVVLGSDLYSRLGVCTAPHCDRVYVDISRNATRRYCSTPCQNRVKTATFRARHP